MQQPQAGYMQPGMVQMQYIPPQGMVSNNQVQAAPINDGKPLNELLKSRSQYVTCPHCKLGGATIVTQSCSCSNLCCCIIFTPMVWAIFQCCRQKDYNCQDAIHQCPKCNTKIYDYQAC